MGGGKFFPPSFPFFFFLPFFFINVLASQCLAVSTASCVSGLQPLRPAPLKLPLASAQVLMAQGCRTWLSVMS